MRAFIVLCLVAAAYADQLGYNYQPVGHADAGLSFTSGAGSFGGASFGGSSFGSGGVGGGGGADAFGSGSSIIGGSSGGFSGSHAPVAESEFNKEFYSFTAPEHEFDDGRAAQEIANSVKQNLRVIFIKGPENKALENAALSLAKHASDQRTAIYVLNKQTDIGELAHKLNAAGSNNHNKPEVHFVKYRTHEDAANAQRAIQSQYDQLGGSSQSHNGGVAPVLNFASPAQVHAAPAPRAPGNAYLPASIFRRRI